MTLQNKHQPLLCAAVGGSPDTPELRPVKGKIALIGTVVSCILGFRRELIEMLVAEGYQVYAFGIDYTPETEAAVRALGACPVTYQLNRTGVNPFQGLISILRLSQQLKAIAPDLVLSYFVKPVVFGSLAASWAKVPKRFALLEGLGLAFTAQPHKPGVRLRLIRRALILLYRSLLPGLDQVIFLNPDDRAELQAAGCLPKSNSSILGGIGLTLADFPYSSPAPGTVNFLFVGRLLREKGIAEFIAAARKVKSRYPQARFTVVGGLDEQSPGGLSLRQWQQLLDEGVIDYRGTLADILPCLQQASVFVLPSYREGVPRSTQEAMAVGRAVITTDVPGCRETVSEGVNGFLIPAWDVDALVGRMLYCIEHPAEVVQMGLASRRMAEACFDARKVNARLLQILGLECAFSATDTGLPDDTDSPPA